MLKQQTIHDMLTRPVIDVATCTIPESLERRYDRLLASLHFLPSLKEYPYLKQAFYHEHQNRHNLPSLTKDIYGEIAKIYNTQIAAVERCITFAVKKAFRDSPEEFQKLFPDCKKPPSNFRFIKTISLHLNYSLE